VNGEEVIVAVAALATAVFLLFLVTFFFHVRLWLEALLTNTPVGLLDIIRMRLRGCPPRLLVHAMIALSQRGVKVSAREVEGYYLAAVVRGEPVSTADELAGLVAELKRGGPPPT
jgi:uncharacterized protein YqfA (UPF0365 family)